FGGFFAHLLGRFHGLFVSTFLARLGGAGWFAFERRHGAAAAFCAAQAFVLFSDGLGEPLVQYQAIVVIQLLAALDIAQGLDEHAMVVSFFGFAVGLARVVDPLGFVATHAAVDHLAVTQRKEKRVKRIIGIDRMTPISFFCADDFTDVFEDNRASRYVARGIDACAVDTGRTQNVPGFGWSGVAAHVRWTVGQRL